ncbi:MAG: alpha/beta fold hydrolase [Fimbriiglobus sp.]|jgi:triacylglycerol lipase|nr:alpha/beta fold hydrolase [Fimbriiglobus sp.]
MNSQQDPPTPHLAAPVVLVHGLSGFDRVLGVKRPGKEFFPGVRTHLEAAGNRVLLPRVSATAAVATRAAELAAFIRREVGATKVHLIGHSMGGLDARYAVSRLGLDSQVLSVTTIGCPHRGTAFADWGVRRFGRLTRPLFRAAGIPDAAFYDLTTESCERFNAETPDALGVRYFSVAGVVERPWLTRGWELPSRIVRNAEGPNDGVVSVASATWGECTAIWRGDHLNLVNWPNRRMRKAGEWPDRTGDYAALLGQLQRAGF